MDNRREELVKLGLRLCDEIENAAPIQDQDDEPERDADQDSHANRNNRCLALIAAVRLDKVSTELGKADPRVARAYRRASDVLGFGLREWEVARIQWALELFRILLEGEDSDDLGDAPPLSNWLGMRNA